MKTASKLNLLSMPDLREEIALGQETREITKLRIVRHSLAAIARCVRTRDFNEAATYCTKLAGILRAWDARKKADTLATLKSSAPTAPTSLR